MPFFSSSSILVAGLPQRGVWPPSWGGLISLLPAFGLQPPVCSDTGARTGGGLGGKNQEGRGVMGLEQQVGSKADPPQEGRGFE